MDIQSVPEADLRISERLDYIADVVYARLLSTARAEGLGLYVTTLERLPYKDAEVGFKRSVARILVDLLDASGEFLPKPWERHKAA